VCEDVGLNINSDKYVVMIRRQGAFKRKFNHCEIKEVETFKYLEVK
jgi:hypothetical protein